jgi:nucleoside-diphosphate-sugar epimerase
MHVTVTGAGGFLGKRLISQLLQRGSLVDSSGNPRPITKIIAADVSLAGLPADPRIERVEADASDPKIIAQIITDKTRTVFHLAAVVSLGAEEDFDLGMRVNLDTTRTMLDTCRKNAKGASFLFASSAAVYRGDMPPVIEDGLALTPQTSYGTQKAICEMLISDYSRKGFIDGRSLRLPTVVVRPGRPNKAASTFASSIIREPLEGREVICPVPPEAAMALISPRKVIEAFTHAQSIAAEKWGFSRAVHLPAFTLTIRQMLEALEQVAGPTVARRVRFEPDARIVKIVYGWPTAFHSARAERLGFTTDTDMKDVIRAFIADDLGGKFVA